MVGRAGESAHLRWNSGIIDCCCRTPLYQAPKSGARDSLHFSPSSLGARKCRLLRPFEVVEVGAPKALFETSFLPHNVRILRIFPQEDMPNSPCTNSG